MDNYNLWSLRLGFSGKQEQLIRKEGIKDFLKNSFATVPDTALPDFMKDEARTPAQINAYRNSFKTMEGGNMLRQKLHRRVAYDFKGWWIGKMMNDKYPLREKMTVFWHNHYVATDGKIEVNYWMYTHNRILRENAFGNFRELTKKMLRSNSLVKYLDNDQNIKDRYNENLSRELLELFTIGVGNYTEDDIKNGAKGLAGLTPGAESAEYLPKNECPDPITYFNKTGHFKSDAMVDIIFEQPNAPYFITRKLLKWFIYDDPSEEMVKYYGDYLKKKDYEIEPLLTKIVTTEFKKPTAGSKIKDPLVYYIQLHHELNASGQNNKIIAVLLRRQGMDLYGQNNVKGWYGGTYWITAQLYLQRNTTADMLCRGNNLNHDQVVEVEEDEVYPKKIGVRIDYTKKGTNKEVISELKNRLLFTVSEDQEKEFEQILQHDFNPNGKSADTAVLQLFNYMVRTPEFQLI